MILHGSVDRWGQLSCFAWLLSSDHRWQQGLESWQLGWNTCGWSSFTHSVWPFYMPTWSFFPAWKSSIVSFTWQLDRAFQEMWEDVASFTSHSLRNPQMSLFCYVTLINQVVEAHSEYKGWKFTLCLRVSCSMPTQGGKVLWHCLWKVITHISSVFLLISHPSIHPSTKEIVKAYYWFINWLMTTYLEMQIHLSKRPYVFFRVKAWCLRPN